MTIVDDYVDKVTKRSNTVFSHYATYIGNVQIAIARYEAERLASKSDVVITCGTLVETGVYQAINGLTMNQTTDNPQHRALWDRRSDVTMMWLGLFGFDTWDYDLAFYLPHSGDDLWETKVDEAIAESAEAFGVTYKELANPESRLSEILSEIVQGEELEAAPSNELAST